MDKNKKSINLMIVEDHSLTRIGLKAYFEKNCNVKVVAETPSGKEAIPLASKVLPDVILMDIGLEDLNGIDATKQIKKNNPEINIIMLTSHESEKEIIASLSGGADGYCLKDTPPEQLFPAIESVTQGNAWLSSQVADKVLKNILKGQQTSKNEIQKKENSTQKNDNETKASTAKIDTPSFPLSDRELEILKLIVEGNNNQEIADKLFLSLPTIKSHVRNLLNKLSVHDRTQAAVKALKEGIVNFE